MITASHNPKEYNGIKVYGQDGGQLLTDPSNELSDYIDKVENPLEIKVDSLKKLRETNSVLSFPKEITERYIARITDLVGDIDSNKNKTILTSLHGTSLPLLSTILDALNYSNYYIEKTQSNPDGTFPTVRIANPEEEDTFDYGKNYANKVEAGLIIATDPRALGVRMLSLQGPILRRGQSLVAKFPGQVPQTLRPGLRGGRRRSVRIGNFHWPTRVLSTQVA